MILFRIIGKMVNPPSWKRSNWKKSLEVADVKLITPKANDV